MSFNFFKDNYSKGIALFFFCKNYAVSRDNLFKRESIERLVLKKEIVFEEIILNQQFKKKAPMNLRLFWIYGVIP
jgi:hypothetical protein